MHRKKTGITAVIVVAAAIGAASSCAEGETATGASAGASGAAGGCPVDCASQPDTPFCDPGTSACVGCLPGTCDPGAYCDPVTDECALGCEDDQGCQAPLVCDITTHECVGCATDDDCDDGEVCTAAGTCGVGCSDAQPCEGGLSCCDGACADVATDVGNCGACGEPCTEVANAGVACEEGDCQYLGCLAGFEDCNNNTSDGCEWDLADGPCTCTPGDVQACYDGPPGTEGVGPCVAGTSTCHDSGNGWSFCEGQVLPSGEICDNGADEDCDGTADNPSDADGDGWTPCDGDCCDTLADGCGDPGLVNPGAFDAPGNDVDDDCDGVVDEASPTCDGGLASNSADAIEYAKAIDICEVTTEDPPLPEKTWGVISGGFFRANGAGAPIAASRSIRTGFGSGVGPLAGSSLAVLSTGTAAAQAAPNNANPAWAAFQTGQDMGPTITDSAFPADWYAANGNVLPNAPGCPEPAGAQAQDPIMLKLRVRAPTNARSFEVSVFFYSAEYPEWVCSAYNDFFLTLLDSSFVPGPGESPNPADKNLAFYDPPPAGGPVYPVGVNLANTGLFTQCVNGPTGCAGAAPSSNASCVGIDQLVGTGFDVESPPAPILVPAECQPADKAGGGTGWLKTSGNVVPGETIELRFVIWDTSDSIYDSLVLVDDFRWSLTPSTPGTHK